MFLILNCGSSSLKFKLFNLEDKLIADGNFSNIGSTNSEVKYNTYVGNALKFKKRIRIDCVEQAIKILENILISEQYGVINNFNEINVIGHRIVHGGDKYTEPIEYNKEVYKYLNQFSEFNLTHFKNAIDVVNICEHDFNNCHNLLVFDTSFHSTIPRKNYIYPLPLSLTEKYNIRKYGFHGISYSYVLKKYECITDNQKPNVILCHLGGGSSICAVKDGKSYDTTMGLTPNSGLLMSSRCGDLDPLLSAYLLEKENMSFLEIYNLLNEQSGYLSIAGTKDAKEIADRCNLKDEKALLTKEIISENFKKNLLSMMSSYFQLDSIVLTGGMGSKNAYIREALLIGLDYFGIKLDKIKNKETLNKVGIISEQDSKIKIYVIPTDEEFEIYEECKRKILNNKYYK